MTSNASSLNQLLTAHQVGPRQPPTPSLPTPRPTSDDRLLAVQQVGSRDFSRLMLLQVAVGGGGDRHQRVEQPARLPGRQRGPQRVGTRRCPLQGVPQLGRGHELEPVLEQTPLSRLHQGLQTTALQAQQPIVGGIVSPAAGKR